MKNEYTKGNHYTKEEIQRGIVDFMRQKGGEISHDEISDFIFNKFGIRYGEINHVMWVLRKVDNRVIRSEKRGYSKLIPEAMADCK